MPLPRHRPGFSYSANKTGGQEVEVFLDISCPYSAKAFKPLPTLAEVPDVVVKIVCVSQPWHTQSAILHRIILAAALAKPELSWQVFGALYEHSAISFCDSECENLSEKAIMHKAASVLQSVTGIEPDVLVKSAQSSEVTSALKHHTRYYRQNAIHVTPSALYNGCKIADFDSNWTFEDWGKFLQNP